MLKGARLDERVVRDGLAATRTRAQALIRSGRVLVDNVSVEKPGTRVRDGAAIRVRGGERVFVSRGGEKLAAAIQDLGIDPSGSACLDLGASTGGFTDCLLRAGARRVVAVDVGYGQLDAKLRGEEPKAPFDQPEIGKARLKLDWYKDAPRAERKILPSDPAAAASHAASL